MSAQVNRFEPLASHFEPDGDGFFYRRYPDDSPVRVSAAEYDAFAEETRRRSGWLVVTMLTLLVVLGAAGVFLTRGPGGDSAPWALGPVALLVGFSCWATWRVARTPPRTSWPPPRPGELRYEVENRYIVIATFSYRQLAWAVPIAAIAAMNVMLWTDGQSGWRWLWLVAGAAILCPPAVQAFRKWREERAG